MLLTGKEIANLMKVLECKFIEPGLSGMPSDNFGEVLPTEETFIYWIVKDTFRGGL